LEEKQKVSSFLFFHTRIKTLSDRYNEKKLELNFGLFTSWILSWINDLVSFFFGESFEEFSEELFGELLGQLLK
jgi:hypothetical protein